MKLKNVFLIVLLPLIMAFVQPTNDAQPTNINAETKLRVMPPNIGDKAPEIVMLSTDRKTIYKLSQLKGKIVLVNFWASMVAQCRFENPNIASSYVKYKDMKFKSGDGFEVYSVSLDTDVEKWKSAITRDKLSWKFHVSDLKSYESQAAHDYGVKAMPYNFLIDGKGNVIAINLKGAELSKTLESLL